MKKFFLFRSAKFYLSLIQLTLFLSIVIISCQTLPTDPYIPENSYSKLLLKGSDKKIDPSYIEDTIGNIISIGSINLFPDFIDSVRIVVASENAEVIKKELFVPSAAKTLDTSWIPMTFSTPGKLKVYSTAYIQKNLKYIDSAVIQILERKISVINVAPQIKITGSTAISSNDTCKLYVTVSDKNPEQGHVTKMLKAPDSATFVNNVFKWKPDEKFTGIETVIFITADNGSPVLCDTQTVLIGVRTDGVVSEVKLSVATFNNEKVSIVWQAIDSAKLYYVYKSSIVSGNYKLYDSVNTNVYSDSLSLRTNFYYINAKNDKGIIWSSDTLASSVQLATDMTSPRIQLPLGITDSMVINSSEFTMLMKVFDSSGVASVICKLDSKNVPVIKENDSIFKLSASGLKPNIYSTFIVTAEDMSFRKNVTKFVLSVKYNPGNVDTISPVVRLLTPLKDTVVVTAETAVFQVLCKDAQGVTGVVGSLDSKPAVVLKVNDSIYSVSITGLLPDKFSSVIIAASDLAGNTTSLAFTVKYDATKSDTIAPAVSVLKITETNHPEGVDSITIQLLCKDEIGIGTVSGLRSGKTVEMTKDSDSVYSTTVTNLKAGKYDTISFTATDKSVNKNATVLSVILQYKPVYSIIYDGNGKTGGIVPTDINRYTVGTVVTLKGNSGIIVRDGFTFAGWNTKADGSGINYIGGDEFTMPDNNIVVFAKWDPVSYSVTFSSDTATVLPVPLSLNVTHPSTSTGNLPIPPQRTGYVFAGWWTNKIGAATEFNGDTPVNANVTVYARWNQVYTVTFSAVGANVAPVPASIEVVAPANKVETLPTPPLKANHSFLGWWTGVSGTGTNFTSETVLTGSITVYANFVFIARTVAEGSLLSFTLNGDDPNVQTVTYSSSALPTGATLNSTTGVFSWTPSYTQSGSYSVTFRTTDGALVDSDVVAITVTNVNRAPVLDSIKTRTVAEGALLYFTLIGSDPDVQTVTYSSSALPTGATLDSTTGVFAWTPSYTQSGSYTIIFRATDGALVDSEAVVITINSGLVATQINATPVNFTSTDWVADRGKTSVASFNGTNYQQFPNSAAINFDISDFSVSLWIKTSYDYTVLDKRDDNDVGYLMSVYSGVVLFQIQGPGRLINNYDTSSKKVNDSLWHHIVVTIDRDKPVDGGIIYVDNVIQHKFDPVLSYGSITNDSPLYIGRHKNSSTFIGSIDDFRLFNKVLSKTEVNNLFSN